MSSLPASFDPVTADTACASAEAVNTFAVRVYYEDTDAGGVVFYANYLKFFERARTEWLRALGVTQSELVRRLGCIFVVHSLDMQYRRPARLDDLLCVRSRITKIGRSAIQFQQSAHRDGELLAEGSIQVCTVDASTFKLAAIPQEIRSKLTPFQE